ncbi:helix-turn-helix domain-containing protein [Rhizorhabdus argentea]|uniref:helix-turn-helix domain-containing protein n=1 Tax=Rhizorhabdus argentea TaxID=1387174 RepID=UPI003BF59D2D
MSGVDPDLIRRIGSSIGAARERAGISVEQVSSALSLSPELLQEIESGSVDAVGKLDLLTFLKIARAIGSSALNILSDE